LIFLTSDVDSDVDIGVGKILGRVLKAQQLFL